MKNCEEKRARSFELARRIRKHLKEVSSELEKQPGRRKSTPRQAAIKRIAGALAHDFNNLLAVITGNAGLGRMALQSEDPSRAEWNFDEIEKSALRARALTSELLNFAGSSPAPWTEYVPIPAPPRPHAPLRILVMDDQEGLRTMLSEILSAHGHKVTITADGETAVLIFEAAILRGNGFDLAILDLTVPEGMGGKETVLRLKELDPHLKCIATSGYSNDPVIHDCRAFSFDASLVKPYSAHDLLNVLNSVFEERQTRSADSVVRN